MGFALAPLPPVQKKSCPGCSSGRLDFCSTTTWFFKENPKPVWLQSACVYIFIGQPSFFCCKLLSSAISSSLVLSGMDLTAART